MCGGTPSWFTAVTSLTTTGTNVSTAFLCEDVPCASAYDPALRLDNAALKNVFTLATPNAALATWDVLTAPCSGDTGIVSSAREEGELGAAPGAGCACLFESIRLPRTAAPQKEWRERVEVNASGARKCEHQKV